MKKTDIKNYSKVSQPTKRHFYTQLFAIILQGCKILFIIFHISKSMISFHSRKNAFQLSGITENKILCLVSLYNLNLNCDLHRQRPKLRKAHSLLSKSSKCNQKQFGRIHQKNSKNEAAIQIAHIQTLCI